MVVSEPNLYVALTKPTSIIIQRVEGFIHCWWYETFLQFYVAAIASAL